MAEANITSLPATHTIFSIAFNRNVFLSIHVLAMSVFLQILFYMDHSFSLSPKTLDWDNLILCFPLLKYLSPDLGKDEV